MGMNLYAVIDALGKQLRDLDDAIRKFEKLAERQIHRTAIDERAREREKKGLTVNTKAPSLKIRADDERGC